jgi:hypothetical protein
MPEDLRNLSLDELAENAGFPKDERYYARMFQFQKRQTQAPAEYAKQSVRWMFWTLIVLAVASFGSFVLDLLRFLRG